MSKLLLVTSSLMGENSVSTKIAGEFVAAWRAAHPASTVAERKLEADSIPHLSLATLAAIGQPAEQRDPDQQSRANLADTLIEEVEAADTIVIAAPMYNFSIPSTLKAWIDHLARAGRTFRYTAAGPEGLLRGKTVYVVSSRGGVYSGASPAGALDFQEPYLRGILGFLGLTQVQFIHAEGLAMGPESAAQALDKARGRIREILPSAEAA